jgi:membrane protease YdiL (CAAX protease family)
VTSARAGGRSPDSGDEGLDARQEHLTAMPPFSREDITPRARRILAVRAVLRVLATTIGLLALFYLLPMDRDDGYSPVALLAVALAVLSLVTVLQVRAILRSPLPALKAIEALAVSIPLLLLSFASAYFLTSQADPQTFSQSLTRTRALYFTMTVFSTVGFGDITPTTDTMRLVVSAQMFIDLLVIGVGLKLIIGAVQRSRERLTQSSDLPLDAPD